MGELKLVVAYVLPFAVIVWLWLGTANLKIKLLITLILPLIYLFHWSGLQSIKGWPANEKLPLEFQLLAADIVEPTQSENREGAIYLWIRTKRFKYPRAFQLTYNRSLHEQIFEARQRIDDGYTQIGLIRGAGHKGGGAEIGGGRRLEFKNRQRGILPPK